MATPWGRPPTTAQHESTRASFVTLIWLLQSKNPFSCSAALLILKPGFYLDPFLTMLTSTNSKLTRCRWPVIERVIAIDLTTLSHQHNNLSSILSNYTVHIWVSGWPKWHLLCIINISVPAGVCQSGHRVVSFCDTYCFLCTSPGVYTYSQAIRLARRMKPVTF